MPGSSKNPPGWQHKAVRPVNAGGIRVAQSGSDRSSSVCRIRSRRRPGWPIAFELWSSSAVINPSVTVKCCDCRVFNPLSEHGNDIMQTQNRPAPLSNFNNRCTCFTCGSPLQRVGFLQQHFHAEQRVLSETDPCSFKKSYRGPATGLDRGISGNK